MSVELSRAWNTEEERYALEIRAEVLRTLAMGRAMRQGESDRLEVGVGGASDEVIGAETLEVGGKLTERVEWSATTMVGRVKTKVQGHLAIEGANDTTILAGAMLDTQAGGVFLAAGMSDDLVAGGGVRITAMADLWMNGLTGMEEKIGTAAADGAFVEAYAVAFEREYSTGVHNAGAAMFSGMVHTTMASGFRPMVGAMMGVRNLTPGGGGGGGGGAPVPAPPPAPAGGEAAGGMLASGVVAGRAGAQTGSTEDLAGLAKMSEQVSEVGQHLDETGTVPRSSDTADVLGNVRQAASNPDDAADATKNMQEVVDPRAMSAEDLADWQGRNTADNWLEVLNAAEPANPKLAEAVDVPPPRVGFDPAPPLRVSDVEGHSYKIDGILPIEEASVEGQRFEENFRLLFDIKDDGRKSKRPPPLNRFFGGTDELTKLDEIRESKLEDITDLSRQLLLDNEDVRIRSGLTREEIAELPALSAKALFFDVINSYPAGSSEQMGLYSVYIGYMAVSSQAMADVWDVYPGVKGQLSRLEDVTDLADKQYTIRILEAREKLIDGRVREHWKLADFKSFDTASTVITERESYNFIMAKVGDQARQLYSTAIEHVSEGIDPTPYLTDMAVSNSRYWKDDSLRKTGGYFSQVGKYQETLNKTLQGSLNKITGQLNLPPIDLQSATKVSEAVEEANHALYQVGSEAVKKGYDPHYAMVEKLEEIRLANPDAAARIDIDQVLRKLGWTPPVDDVRYTGGAPVPVTAVDDAASSGDLPEVIRVSENPNVLSESRVIGEDPTVFVKSGVVEEPVASPASLDGSLDLTPGQIDIEGEAGLGDTPNSGADASAGIAQSDISPLSGLNYGPEEADRIERQGKIMESLSQWRAPEDGFGDARPLLDEDGAGWRLNPDAESLPGDYDPELFGPDYDLADDTLQSENAQNLDLGGEASPPLVEDAPADLEGIGLPPLPVLVDDADDLLHLDEIPNLDDLPPLEDADVFQPRRGSPPGDWKFNAAYDEFRATGGAQGFDEGGERADDLDVLARALLLDNEKLMSQIDESEVNEIRKQIGNMNAIEAREEYLELMEEMNNVGKVTGDNMYTQEYLEMKSVLDGFDAFAYNKMNDQTAIYDKFDDMAFGRFRKDSEFQAYKVYMDVISESREGIHKLLRDNEALLKKYGLSTKGLDIRGGVPVTTLRNRYLELMNAVEAGGDVQKHLDLRTALEKFDASTFEKMNDAREASKPFLNYSNVPLPQHMTDRDKKKFIDEIQANLEEAFNEKNRLDEEIMRIEETMTGPAAEKLKAQASGKRRAYTILMGAYASSLDCIDKGFNPYHTVVDQLDFAKGRQLTDPDLFPIAEKALGEIEGYMRLFGDDPTIHPVRHSDDALDAGDMGTIDEFKREYDKFVLDGRVHRGTGDELAYKEATNGIADITDLARKMLLDNEDLMKKHGLYLDKVNDYSVSELHGKFTALMSSVNTSGDTQKYLELRAILNNFHDTAYQKMVDALESAQKYVGLNDFPLDSAIDDIARADLIEKLKIKLEEALQTQMDVIEELNAAGADMTKGSPGFEKMQTYGARAHMYGNALGAIQKGNNPYHSLLENIIVLKGKEVFDPKLYHVIEEPLDEIKDLILTNYGVDISLSPKVLQSPADALDVGDVRHAADVPEVQVNLGALEQEYKKSSRAQSIDEWYMSEYGGQLGKQQSDAQEVEAVLEGIPDVSLGQRPLPSPPDEGRLIGDEGIDALTEAGHLLPDEELPSEVARYLGPMADAGSNEIGGSDYAYLSKTGEESRSLAVSAQIEEGDLAFLDDIDAIIRQAEQNAPIVNQPAGDILFPVKKAPSVPNPKDVNYVMENVFPGIIQGDGVLRDYTTFAVMEPEAGIAKLKMNQVEDVVEQLPAGVTPPATSSRQQENRGVFQRLRSFFTRRLRSSGNTRNVTPVDAGSLDARLIDDDLFGEQVWDHFDRISDDLVAQGRPSLHESGNEEAAMWLHHVLTWNALSDPDFPYRMSEYGQRRFFGY